MMSLNSSIFFYVCRMTLLYFMHTCHLFDMWLIVKKFVDYTLSYFLLSNFYESFYYDWSLLLEKTSFATNSVA